MTDEDAKGLGMPDTTLAVAITALSLSNAIVVAMTKKLMAKGVLSKHEAQSMVLEITDLVRHATDKSKSIGIADTLCGDLEDFAAGLKD